MDRDLRAGLALQLGRAADVVEVPVGQDDVAEVTGFGPDPLDRREDPLRAPRSPAVDQQQPFRAPHEIRVPDPQSLDRVDALGDLHGDIMRGHGARPFTTEPTREMVTPNEPPPTSVPWTGIVDFVQVPLAGPKVPPVVVPENERALLVRGERAVQDRAEVLADDGAPRAGFVPGLDLCGFMNDREEPLGEGFDVVVYVTRVGGSDEPTYRYSSDFVLRGTSDRCGPNHKTQKRPETCEWFVHGFPHGLPGGRWAIWAVWEAPCRAWFDLGLADSCQDPAEVTSLFSSGFDAPYREAGPEHTEISR